MKHHMGNSPKCGECAYFRVHTEAEHLRGCNDGWCYEQRAQEVNGRRPKYPRERMQCWHGDSACRWWRDAEDGYTRFEVTTRYREPYDGTKIDFEEANQ